MRKESPGVASSKTLTRSAHILISKYLKLYKETHGVSPTVNRYSAKWGMVDVIESVGMDRANVLLEFYFKTAHKAHDLEFFYKNFVSMEKNMLALEQDRLRRARIMEETRRRVEEGN
jgi:hypothetical protein